MVIVVYGGPVMGPLLAPTITSSCIAGIASPTTTRRPSPSVSCLSIADVPVVNGQRYPVAGSRATRGGYAWAINTPTWRRALSAAMRDPRLTTREAAAVRGISRATMSNRKRQGVTQFVVWTCARRPL